MLLPSILILLGIFTLTTAQKTLVYACESLICDPPKMCILQDQVAQCLLVLAPTPRTRIDVGPELTTPLLTPPPATQLATTPPFVGIPPALPSPTITMQPPTTTTPLSPLAPLLSLLNGGAPPISLPTLPPPPTTTTTPPIDICRLPPLTGTCRHARIMWYYDNETGMCERFSFSGCGNLNRFPSKMQCEMTCLRRGRK
ncbi:Kunitz/Bovine pancreatic trypsin inhibitor domain protein [Ostertagia ostertagi]